MAGNSPRGKVNQHGIDVGMKAHETRGLTDSDVNKLVEVRENNAEAFKAAMNAAVARALEEVGLVAEGHAKAACPVDTGRLRNSITHVVDPDGHGVSIGTNVEYGRYVELGTSRAKAQPFLHPAATEHAEEYEAIMRAALGDR